MIKHKDAERHKDREEKNLSNLRNLWFMLGANRCYRWMIKRKDAERHKDREEKI